MLLAMVGVAALFFGLYRLLGRTPRNPVATHGGGMSGDATGGSYGPD